MTNFQAETNRPTAAWLTPERAVVVVPILAGLALATTLAMAVITPQLVQLRERRLEVEVLEQKSNDLPELVETLAQRRLEQAEVMAQQKRLLALIAGTTQLETFLAQLNDSANKHQVVLTSTEPGAVERAPAPVAGSDVPAAGDPLLMQGLEKRSARIQVEGSFVRVLDFLRSLENLQVFVITEDLSVVAARASKDEAIRVRLGLTLLVYGAERSVVANSGS